MLVYMQVLPPSARTSLCMYGSELNERARTLGWHPQWSMKPSSSTNEVRDCSVPAYAWYQFWVNIILYKLDKQVNSDRSTIDRAARTCARVFAFARAPSCVYDPTLTPPSRTPAKEKTFVGENNLAGVPDNRCKQQCSYTKGMCDCSERAFAWYQFSGEHNNFSKQ